MKYKKYNYIILFILMLLVGINRTYAATYDEKTCYYMSNNNEAMAQLTIKWGYDAPFLRSGKKFSEVIFNKLGAKPDADSETILNWYNGFYDSSTGITLNAIYQGSSIANENPSCPTYLIMRSNDNFKSYGAFATKSEIEAQRFVEASNQKGYKTWYLGHTKTDEDGTIREITEEEYWNAFGGFVQGESIVDFDAKFTCTELFGDSNDENSLAYMINMILGYVRIIVPILVIIFGLFDLGKAVIASKEDEMRKAQSTFIKRVLIGVVVFFVPTVVNIVMELADIVWEGMGYTICEFK